MASSKTKGQTGRPCIGAVVFGSDQGLVVSLTTWWLIMPSKPSLLCLQTRGLGGGRSGSRPFSGCGPAGNGIFPCRNSVQAITPLVGQIQIESKRVGPTGGCAPLCLPQPDEVRVALRASQPRLLLLTPMGRSLAKLPWPTKLCRSHVQRRRDSAGAHPRISFHLHLRACAESLASENASRLAAMEAPIRH